MLPVVCLASWAGRTLVSLGSPPNSCSSTGLLEEWGNGLHNNHLQYSAQLFSSPPSLRLPPPCFSAYSGWAEYINIAVKPVYFCKLNSKKSVSFAICALGWSVFCSLISQNRASNQSNQVWFLKYKSKILACERKRMPIKGFILKIPGGLNINIFVKIGMKLPFTLKNKCKTKFERRWTIIALINLIFYFWSNIELTWHECSFMYQITKYKEKIKKKQNFWT